MQGLFTDNEKRNKSDQEAAAGARRLDKENNLVNPIHIIITLIIFNLGLLWFAYEVERVTKGK